MHVLEHKAMDDNGRLLSHPRRSDIDVSRFINTATSTTEVVRSVQTSFHVHLARPLLSQASSPFPAAHRYLRIPTATGTKRRDIPHQSRGLPGLSPIPTGSERGRSSAARRCPVGADVCVVGAQNLSSVTIGANTTGAAGAGDRPDPLVHG